MPKGEADGKSYTVAKGPALAELIIDEIIGAATDAIDAQGSFNLALSGGSLVALLDHPRFVNNLDAWYERWNIFLVDERCVPVEDAESTFGTYQRLLGDFVKRVQQFPAPYTDGTAEAAAAAYEAILPWHGSLDMVILGMGPDGHTASLFPPTTSAMLETKRWVEVVHDSPKPPSPRITMTLPYLQRADRIIFLATGAAKSAILRQVLVEEDETLPVTVLARSEKSHWFLDGAAASMLQ